MPVRRIGTLPDKDEAVAFDAAATAGNDRHDPSRSTGGPAALAVDGSGLRVAAAAFVAGRSRIRKSLYEASRAIEHIYSPVDGVASLVTMTADGSSAEVGTIGNEGARNHLSLCPLRPGRCQAIMLHPRIRTMTATGRTAPPLCFIDSFRGSPLGAPFPSPAVNRPDRPGGVGLASDNKFWHRFRAAISTGCFRIVRQSPCSKALC